MWNIFILIFCFFLNACFKVGPNYKEPPKRIEEHWLKQDRSVKESTFTNEQWWGVFHDPVLTDLIHKGYQNNLTLQIAGVHVLQTRALLAQSVGNLYPQQQGAGGNFTYYRIGGNYLQNVLPESFDTAALGFTANWELDFWGKYRRAIESKDAMFLASLAAYDNALVTLVADIAGNYIKLRTIQKQIKVTKANIVVQKMGVRIAKSRFGNGQTSLVDVEQALTELYQTEATLPSLTNEEQRKKDMLAVLLGTVPNEINGLVKKSRGIPNAPTSVAVGIPRETMARRPDVYQARMEAIAQGAAIGAIKATLYPSIQLAGTFYFASNNIIPNSLGELFNWQNRNINAGPAFSWPLLNYGQITNAVRAQDAVFQEYLLRYINLVLRVQQEVQDNITGYIESKVATRYLTQANTAATKSLKLAMVRYREGETDFTPVLLAEQQQLNVEMALVNAQGDISQSLVALYRALGGGWQIRDHNDIIPETMKKEMAARTKWGVLLQQANHQPPTNKKQLFNQLYLPKW